MWHSRPQEGQRGVLVLMSPSTFIIATRDWTRVTSIYAFEFKKKKVWPDLLPKLYFQIPFSTTNVQKCSFLCVFINSAWFYVLPFVNISFFRFPHQLWCLSSVFLWEGGGVELFWLDFSTAFSPTQGFLKRIKIKLEKQKQSVL